MRRGVTLVATGVTAFSVVISASVAYAYRARAESPIVKKSLGMVVAPTGSESEANGVQTREALSPQAVAALAESMLQRQDAYSIQLADWNGQQAYKVTFSSGDVAFLGMDGTLLEFVPTSQYVAYAGGGGGGGQRAFTDSRSDEEHEFEDEHESEADHGD